MQNGVVGMQGGQLVVAGGVVQVQGVANGPVFVMQVAPAAVQVQQLQVQQAAIAQARAAEQEQLALMQARQAVVAAEAARAQAGAGPAGGNEAGNAAAAQAAVLQQQAVALAQQQAALEQRMAALQVQAAQAQMGQVQMGQGNVAPMALREMPVTVQVVVEGKVVGTYMVMSDLTVRFPATEKPVKLVVKHAAGVKEARLPVALKGVVLP